MKKRFLTALIALIACIACVVGLVACGGSADPVAGNTYVFESATITKGADGEMKEMLEASINTTYQGSSFSFDEEGNFTMTAGGTSMSGTYKQSGATVTATIEGDSQKLKVSGDTLTITNSLEGITVKITYKLVGADSAE